MRDGTSPQGGHGPTRCQPCRGAHTACACSSARPTMRRKMCEGRDEVGEGSPHGAPSIWPHALWARPRATRTSPSPVLGPCCGNLAPPGKLSPAGLPTRLLSAPTSLCCSQLLCTFRWPLRPLQGTPGCTRSHQECPRDSSGQSFQLDPGARLWAQLPIRTPD